MRAVERESADQPRERCEIEQQPVDDNSGAGASAQSDNDLGRHVQVNVTDPLARALLLLLDGSRDRAALVEELSRGLATGTIKMPGKQWPSDPAALREGLTRDLETSLRSLAQMSMLTG